MATSTSSPDPSGTSVGMEGLHVTARTTSNGSTGPPALAADPGMTLAVRHHDRDGLPVLELSGECDIATLEVLQAALVQAVPAARARTALIVDVSALTFCDVRSAELVLQAGRTVRTSLAGAEGVVKRVFDLVDTSHALARCDGPRWSTPTA